jgi:PAS domain S-box-containing protein
VAHTDATSRLYRPEPLRPDWLVQVRSRAFLGNLLVFELAFLAAYLYGMSGVRSGSAFWLPDSVLLCALLFSHRKKWIVYVAATLPIRLFVAVPPDTPMWFLLATFLSDSLKAALSATLLQTFFRGRKVRFETLRDFWIYLGAVVVFSPALSATAGAASWVARGQEFWPSWRDWFLGDALANLVLTPLLLYLLPNWRNFIRAKPLRFFEGFAVFSGFFGAIVFAQWRDLTYHTGFDFHDYVPVVFLLLAGVRFGPAGASACLAAFGILRLSAGYAGQPVLSAAPGTTTVLSMQLFLLVIGIPILSLSVLIEEQRRTQRSLRESEARFRDMADTAPVMIWISGPDKLATFFNRGWLDFTGRTMEAETGLGWASSVHPDHRQACMAAYSSAFEDRHVWTGQYLLRRVDGEYRWALCSGSPRFDEDGTFEGYIVSFSDITDVRNAQEASMARQKLESLGILTGGIAHDFNNLIGSIYATAEIAESNEAEGVFPGEEIRSIKAIAKRASGIVRQLTIYAGDEAWELALVDLSELVREMLDLIRISVSKSAEVRSDLRATLPAFLGNAPQIEQVVMNLILNASDALGGKAGVITVRTSGDEMGHVILEVSDTGCGISKEARAKIFDPFYTTKGSSRGLGLAVVQGVVRAHKARIDIVSEPGEGTTFRISWPAAKSGADAALAARPSPRGEANTGTILVVEDEEILRRGIAKTLLREGFRVVEARDGDRAMDLLRDPQIDIDLLLLDLTIPGTPSRAVAAESSRLRPNAKLLLTSAYSGDRVGAVSEAAHVNGFIRKPFELRELVGKVREVLAG